MSSKHKKLPRGISSRYIVQCQIIQTKGHDITSPLAVYPGVKIIQSHSTPSINDVDDAAECIHHNSAHVPTWEEQLIHQRAVMPLRAMEPQQAEEAGLWELHEV